MKKGQLVLVTIFATTVIIAVSLILRNYFQEINKHKLMFNFTLKADRWRDMQKYNQSWSQQKQIKEREELERSKRNQILEKHYQTQLKDIQVAKKLKALQANALQVQKSIESKSLNQVKLDIIEIPFRNGSIKLAYQKYKYGINRIFEEDYCHEMATLLAISSIIKPYFKVIDIGLFYGIYTLRIASLLDESQGGMQYSFDADPISIQYVNASVHLNGYEKRAKVYNYAVYNQTQDTTFNVFLRGYLGQIDSLQQQRKNRKIKQQSDVEQSTQFKILAISLDDFFPSQVLPEIHFIKIDIENADLMALQGAQKLIMRSREVVIIIE